VERAPKNLVVDASVAAKWFVPEADSDKAIRLRNRHIEGSLTLIAPDLLVYEVANALVYHPEILVEDLKDDLEALFMIDVELVPPSSELISSIAEKARLDAVSVYDSSYLTLAEVTATNLVTADRKLYDKVKDKGRVFILDELDQKWTI
jgi:predicted nucleic acid-binding protein